MPSDDRRTRSGANSPRISAAQVRAVLTMRACKDSKWAAFIAAESPDVIRVQIGHVEQKTGWKLFDRHRGRQTTGWAPLESAAPFFTWCSENTAGGEGWPRPAPVRRRGSSYATIGGYPT